MPNALNAPGGPLVVIDDALISEGIGASRRSERRRIILPLHTRSAEACQRMLNVVQPGSYIRPHRHADPPKSETVVVLRGALTYVAFHPDGSLDRRVELAAGSARVGVDTRPGVYHTFFATEPDTVVFEAKTGPYVEAEDKEVATWAPAAGSPEADAYLKRLSGGAGPSVGGV